MEALLTALAEFGPAWILVGAIIWLIYHFGTKLLDIYDSKTKSQMQTEAKREERKQDEVNARIEHDREMAEIKGQMVEAMRESNTLMDCLRTLMEQVKTSNDVLHEDLKASQAGSRQMQSDMHDVKQKVDFIYAKEA